MGAQYHNQRSRWVANSFDIKLWVAPQSKRSAFYTPATTKSNSINWMLDKKKEDNDFYAYTIVE